MNDAPPAGDWFEQALGPVGCWEYEDLCDATLRTREWIVAEERSKFWHYYHDILGSIVGFEPGYEALQSDAMDQVDVRIAREIERRLAEEQRRFDEESRRLCAKYGGKD